MVMAAQMAYVHARLASPPMLCGCTCCQGECWCPVYPASGASYNLESADMGNVEIGMRAGEGEESLRGVTAALLATSKRVFRSSVGRRSHMSWRRGPADNSSRPKTVLAVLGERMDAIVVRKADSGPSTRLPASFCSPDRLPACRSRPHGALLPRRGPARCRLGATQCDRRHRAVDVCEQRSRASEEASGRDGTVICRVSRRNGRPSAGASAATIHRLVLRMHGSLGCFADGHATARRTGVLDIDSGTRVSC